MKCWINDFSDECSTRAKPYQQISSPAAGKLGDEQMNIFRLSKVKQQLLKQRNLLRIAGQKMK